MVTTLALPSCYQSVFTSVVSASYNANNSNIKTYTATGTFAGYYPIGVVGYNHGYTNIRSAGVKITARSVGSVTVEFKIMRDNSTATTSTVRATILWIKA